MELSEIRTKIDAVDDQLLGLFLERMALSEEVAAYKNQHSLPILNKQREREILAKVTERAGDKERYAYHLYSTLFELARSRQAELISVPTRVAERVEAALKDGGEIFPQTGLVACQGVEGANSQVACDRLLPRGNIMYVKSFQAVAAAVKSVRVVEPRTNIVLLDLAESGIDGKVFSARLEERGVLAHLVPGHVRLTFHLGISREDAMEAARAVIETAEGGAHGTGGV